MVEILVALFLAFIVVRGLTAFAGEGGGVVAWRRRTDLSAPGSTLQDNTQVSSTGLGTLFWLLLLGLAMVTVFRYAATTGAI